MSKRITRILFGEYPPIKLAGRIILIRDYTGKHYFYGIKAWIKYRNER